MEAFRTVIFASLLAISAGCDIIAGGNSASDAAVQRFHQQLNDQRYEDIIRTAWNWHTKG